MENKIIKIGYLVSYDWRLLRNSIPCVYEQADSIHLAIDKNRRTWAGNPFAFDEAEFARFITSIDVKNKIQIYEDDFFDSTRTTMQNEVRERNMLASAMGSGGWHIQLDADEYPVDFDRFVNVLKKIDKNPNPNRIGKPVNVTGTIITVIKKVRDGYLLAEPVPGNLEKCVLATQVPHYENGRRNGYFNIDTSLVVVHESRSRSDEEFYFKLKNWGHNKDFDTDSYFNLWKAIDGYNYRFIKDFNPLGGGQWPALLFEKAKDIDELIEKLKHKRFPIPSPLSLAIGNSRQLARVRSVLNYALKYFSRSARNFFSQ